MLFREGLHAVHVKRVSEGPECGLNIQLVAQV